MFHNTNGKSKSNFINYYMLFHHCPVVKSSWFGPFRQHTILLFCKSTKQYRWRYRCQVICNHFYEFESNFFYYQVRNNDRTKLNSCVFCTIDQILTNRIALHFVVYASQMFFLFLSSASSLIEQHFYIVTQIQWNNSRNETSNIFHLFYRTISIQVSH